ncbi:transposase [Hyella patelloides LEGE 07179]|uniref:Transposase n=1 Tax=Hyella patelloides LEGE 07179 TaxID=945734 RepID=A0A563VS93_9CYAN|nr:IS200/IS605 family transposase [Hyella patelloides]VEP14159.1 transposase [Hyella patelloides LEGE 07179]
MAKLKPHIHSFGFNLVHIVFVTSGRHPVINEVIEIRLRELIEKLCKTQDCELIECQADLGTKDHIHLLIDVAPKISLSKLCNIPKTITSREIRKEFADFLKPYYWKPNLGARSLADSKSAESHRFWKRGFGYTSAGGAPLTVLKQYIENQGYKS